VYPIVHKLIVVHQLSSARCRQWNVGSHLSPLNVVIAMSPDQLSRNRRSLVGRSVGRRSILNITV